MRCDIVPGGVFPDYELPDRRAKRKLSALRAKIHSSLRWRGSLLHKGATNSIWNSPSTRRLHQPTLGSSQ